MFKGVFRGPLSERGRGTNEGEIQTLDKFTLIRETSATLQGLFEASEQYAWKTINIT